MKIDQRIVCDLNQCAGCMACLDICPCNAISIVDRKKKLNAVIDTEKCIQCNACHNVCQKNHPAGLREPQEWLQGWGDKRTRATSSSGGFGQAVMRAALQNGISVAACRFFEGSFKFNLFTNESELTAYIGSKYAKSNPIGIYKKVREKLRKGEKVLFIGLPCQVSSMRNFTKDHKNLYTIDLICHGTPSIRFLQESMNEYGKCLSDMQEISFRKKDQFLIRCKPDNALLNGIQDCYTRAFLQGLCYTDNCYSCQYACQKRVGDLTIGDSWGTEMLGELRKGISLILCQTEKGRELLDIVNFHFFPVDKENSIKMNRQLKHPTVISKKRNVFFSLINNGISFNHAVSMIYPRDFFKQKIKQIMIECGLYKGMKKYSLCRKDTI